MISKNLDLPSRNLEPNYSPNNSLSFYKSQRNTNIFSQARFTTSQNPSIFWRKTPHLAARHMHLQGWGQTLQSHRRTKLLRTFERFLASLGRQHELQHRRAAFKTNIQKSLGILGKSRTKFLHPGSERFSDWLLDLFQAEVHYLAIFQDFHATGPRFNLLSMLRPHEVLVLRSQPRAPTPREKHRKWAKITLKIHKNP